MLRQHNLHMKEHEVLRKLNFHQISSTGSWVNNKLYTPVDDGRTLGVVRGFKTAISAYDDNQILCNLEPVHKLVQRQNVFEIMIKIRESRPQNLQEALRAEMTGKIVICKHNNRVYKIEDINFKLSPASTFELKREKRQITYAEYYKNRFNLLISDMRQSLLLATPNNNRKGSHEEYNSNEEINF